MDKYQQKIIINGIVKRMAITILCCLPILVVLGYFMQSLNRVATIAIFVLFMFTVICFEEIIYAKIYTKKQLKKKILHKDEDVFK